MKTRLSRAAARGYTLTEILMALAVLVILSAVAIPSFREMFLAQAVKTAGFDVFSGLLLARSEAKVCAEIRIARAFHVVSQSGDRAKVAKMYAPGSALTACEGYLREHFPGVVLIDVHNAMAAVQRAQTEPDAAALATTPLRTAATTAASAPGGWLPRTRASIRTSTAPPPRAAIRATASLGIRIFQGCSESAFDTARAP